MINGILTALNFGLLYVNHTRGNPKMAIFNGAVAGWCAAVTVMALVKAVD